MPGKRGRPGNVAVLEILNKLSDPDVSVDALEEIIKRDPALSYKLLRYINSARFALHTKIESLRQVILLLGVQGVRTMAMLASLAGSAQRPGDLLKDALQRAAMCECLARLLRVPSTSAYFTAGLLSSLDAVLEMPLSDILNSLSLKNELTDAVLDRTGPIGEVLTCAIATERADWEAIACGHLSPQEIRGAFLSAIDEVNQLWASFGA